RNDPCQLVLRDHKSSVAIDGVRRRHLVARDCPAKKSGAYSPLALARCLNQVSDTVRPFYGDRRLLVAENPRCNRDPAHPRRCGSGRDCTTATRGRASWPIRGATIRPWRLSAASDGPRNLGLWISWHHLLLVVPLAPRSYHCAPRFAHADFRESA